MKKILSYILLAFFALSMPGCKKYLEVNPTNVRAVSTYEDVESMLGGYLRMFTAVSTDAMAGVNIPWRSTNLYTFFDIYADDLDTDLFLVDRLGDDQNISPEGLYLESLDWQNPTMPGTIWDLYYLNIGFLNTVIDETADVDATQVQKDVVVMEAKFLRAWYLFKLMQYFSPYKENSLGLPYNFDSQAVGSYDRSRKTQTECYGTIIAELQQVLNCSTPPLKGYNIWYNKDFANALLAQVYHFKSGSGAADDDDYDNAIAHATAVLDKYPLPAKGYYEPMPGPDKVPAAATGMGVYTGLTNQPALVTVYSPISGGYMHNYSTGIMSNCLYPTEELYDLYGDDDVRRAFFFNPESDDKYSRGIVKMGYGGYFTRLTFNFFHLADMHLIVAECLARQNDPAAATWLEDFRRERYDNYTPWTGDVLEGILLERRKEFAFEYDMRWLDLRRNPKELTRNSYNNADMPTYTLTQDDFRWCMPIPVDKELQYNNIEQNPGWGMF